MVQCVCILTFDLQVPGTDQPSVVQKSLHHKAGLQDDGVFMGIWMWDCDSIRSLFLPGKSRHSVFLDGLITVSQLISKQRLCFFFR